jgi:hypothetical protein
VNGLRIAAAGLPRGANGRPCRITHPLLEEPMTKLTLNLDALRVDTFVAAPDADDARGTVHANMNSNVYSCLKTCICPSHHNTECCFAE